MIYSRLVLAVAFAFSFSDVLTAQSGTPISQSDMPWTSPGSGTYFLSEDVRQPKGLALNIQHDNVTVLLNGHTVQWGVNGDGMMIDINNHDNVTLRGPGRFVQGDANPALDFTENARIEGTNITIDGGIQFILKATPRVRGSRSFFRGGGNDSSVIRDCSFDISGDGYYYLLNHVGHYKFLTNEVRVHDWTHSSKWWYSKMFRDCQATEFGHNVIDIGKVHNTNVWIAWGDDDYHIHHNTVRFAAIHGRIVLADQGCKNWLVEHNNITVTSDTPPQRAVYAFMVRVPNGGTTEPSTGHKFLYNELDMTAASGALAGFTFGDSNYQSDVVIQNNIFRGISRLMLFPGGTTNNIDVSCNQFIHDHDRGYAIVVQGGSSAADFSNNLWQTRRSDNILMHGTGALNWTMCDNEGFADSSRMSTSVGGVTFTSESACGNVGAPDCWQNAGSDVEPAPPLPPAPPPPPPTLTKPLPPSNIRIE